MSTPVPGWYDDGHGRQRYWDGAQWTEHVAPAAGTSATPSSQSAPGAPASLAEPAKRTSLKGLWIALIVVGAVVVIGAIVAVCLLLFLPKSSPDQTVRGYNSAWHDGNCDTIKRLTTESWKTSYAFDCASVTPSSGAPWDVRFLSIDIENDVALVEYTVTGTGQNGQSFSQTYNARLIEQGTTWLIDSDDLVSSE